MRRDLEGRLVSSWQTWNRLDLDVESADGSRCTLRFACEFGALERVLHEPLRQELLHVVVVPERADAIEDHAGEEVGHAAGREDVRQIARELLARVRGLVDLRDRYVQRLGTDEDRGVLADEVAERDQSKLGEFAFAALANGDFRGAPHTLAAVAGEPNVKEKLLTGYRADGKIYKVHLDGYNQLPLLTGKTDKSPRKEIFYFSDDGDLTALRYGDWKLIFMEQKTEETLRIWMEPFVMLRIPLIINLRRDPYERGMKTSNTYLDWLIDRAYLLVPAQAYVGKFLETFREYPPRMKAASFSLDQVMKKLEESIGSK